MKNILIYLLKIISFFLKGISKLVKKLTSQVSSLSDSMIYNLENDSRLFSVEDIHYNKRSKLYTIIFKNNDDIRGLEFIKILWNTLSTLKEWNSVNKKVMMVAFYNPITERYFYIHRNIPITSETTALDYYKAVINQLRAFLDAESSDESENYTIIKVEFWSYDDIRKINKKSISNKRFYSTDQMDDWNKKCEDLMKMPLPPKNEIKKRDPWFIYPLKRGGELVKAVICTLDIETIEWNNVQIPICITFAYNKLQGIKTVIVMIDHKLLLVDENKAIKKMWLNFYQMLKDESIGSFLVIYTHNLGAFDGYFIYPSLHMIANNHNDVGVLTDDRNKFILISYSFYIENNKIKWQFLDSNRLFPGSLNDLCKNYGIEGKTTEYKPEWNNIKLFNNPILLEQFKKYAVNDSVILLQILIKARIQYLELYKTDIVRAVSSPSLSLLIYRLNSQNVAIPILKRELDIIIREAYYGGSSDYYYKYGVNIKYYDINSLYPYAMLKDMPLTYIGVHEGIDIELENCFGFIEAIITAPDDIKIPLLPYKHNGKIIHPIGTWKGTYFSEELKAVKKQGYKIEIVKYYEFSREADLFKIYIETLYEVKKNAKTPTERYIAKLHLNTFYGLFGRRLDITMTITATPEEERDIINKYPVKNIIQINDNLKLFLIYSNLDYDLINKLKVNLNLELLKQKREVVKSNVAIASAITSYARIEMMKYKTIPGINVLYTDTDSVFLDKELPAEFVGNELGQMKDELKGGYISEAYFLGIKKYAYKDNTGNVKTIFSGVPRNSIEWKDIEFIANDNGVIKKNVPNQFFKSFNNLEISIKPKKVEIKFLTDKKLENNKYLPIKINTITTTDKLIHLIKKIRRIVNKYLW